MANFREFIALCSLEIISPKIYFMAQSDYRTHDFVQQFLADIPAEYKDRAERCLLLTATILPALQQAGFDRQEAATITAIVASTFYRLDIRGWKKK